MTASTTDAQIFPRIISTTVTPTFSVGGAQNAGDYAGPSTVPMEFTLAARTGGGRGRITAITIVDKAANTAANNANTLHLFNATVTVPLDNAAWDITDADALKEFGFVVFASTDVKLSASNAIAHKNGLNIPFVLAAGGTSIFAALVVTATPTYATGDVQITLFVEQAV